MNPSKVEAEDLFHHHLDPQHHQILDQSQPSILHQDDEEPFFSDIGFFRDEDDDAASHSSSDPDQHQLIQSSLPHLDQQNGIVSANPNPNPNLGLGKSGDKNKAEKRHRHTAGASAAAYINPEPHISSQFYTFNKESHALMIRCLLEGRVATPEEIRSVTPASVLQSWRVVWKDRNEDTAYLTAWKRIQDKLVVSIDPVNGNELLCFKNNSSQFVSHVDQWHDIVTSFHRDADLKHLGLKETIEKIKQVWTVGAKFYGIPESYIRVCVEVCPVCSESAPRTKRRRFEYTESFYVPAKEVPVRLQQLAAKYKVVLCIRQKYIRYKPFMAEVKDYACHRAGEPASSKKSRILKREPYASKRCGCGFRIRAIVPISNYNEKDKTFVYQEEGTAVFKLYAVHSGHEPGPLDGNARIMHRVVGHKGGFLMDQETVYGMGDEAENEDFGFLGKDGGDLQHSILQQMQEARNEIGLLEGQIGKVPHELLCSVSRELFDFVNKLRNVREYGSKSVGLLSDKPISDDLLVGENDLADWGAHHHHHRIYEDGKDAELIEEDEDSFGRTLGEVASWDQIRSGCRNEKDLLGESCKSEKPVECNEFDQKRILECGNSKLTKPLRHDESIDTDVGFVVENFYPENPKWFDSPCELDSGTDCGDSGFKPGEIV
ncbi:uncharacterized protein LOC107831332 [Nicotiana tabacum]|uniref:Uncharacterized protein LOC107831332 n=2 Tax=Nicotiana tabacum TaxID=4097 RepID=A0AC58TAV5_TOBAC|nr:PREDICTED: uncharacterized protein LOC107831332 [Nicotiana tabacum]